MTYVWEQDVGLLDPDLDDEREVQDVVWLMAQGQDHERD